MIYIYTQNIKDSYTLTHTIFMYQLYSLFLVTNSFKHQQTETNIQKQHKVKVIKTKTKQSSSLY